METIDFEGRVFTIPEFEEYLAQETPVRVRELVEQQKKNVEICKQLIKDNGEIIEQIKGLIKTLKNNDNEKLKNLDRRLRKSILRDQEVYLRRHINSKPGLEEQLKEQQSILEFVLHWQVFADDISKKLQEGVDSLK